MNIKELDGVINDILEQETKKLIMEQITKTDHLIDSVKSFQTLSGLTDKISNIESQGNGILININSITPEELVDCCGGSSFTEAQKNLMQGLHHDLEDNGMGNNFDVDVESSGDENELNLQIKIDAGENDLLGDNDMKENMEKSEKNKSFGEELYAAKEAGEKKFKHDGQEFDVDECWKQLEEEEMITAPVDEKKKEPEILLGSKEGEIDEKTDKWIQKAINPKHKGYCTPMTKKTCTPARKALAKRLKKGIETNESMEKRIITLSEQQMAELLKKIIIEASSESRVDATTERAQSDADRQNKDALKAVEEKIKKYLSFEGNDNPEFPNQVGQGEEKAARQNTEEQDEIVADNRGRGPQDLDYDNDKIDDNGEPNKKFKERMEKALTGDSIMGNSQDAGNAVPSKTGEKIVKNMKRRQENLRKEPIYAKEAVPVDTKPEPKLGRPVNEGEEKKPVEKPKAEEKVVKKLNHIVEEEIKKMKRLSSYNDKTQ